MSLLESRRAKIAGASGALLTAGVAAFSIFNSSRDSEDVSAHKDGPVSTEVQEPVADLANAPEGSDRSVLDLTSATMLSKDVEATDSKDPEVVKRATRPVGDPVVFRTQVTVLNGQGQPVPDAKIYFLREHDGRFNERHDDKGTNVDSFTMTTDPNGVAELSLRNSQAEAMIKVVPHLVDSNLGNFTYSVKHPAYMSWSSGGDLIKFYKMELPENEPVERTITLAPAISYNLFGEVLEEGTYNPVDGAEVSINFLADSGVSGGWRTFHHISMTGETNVDGIITDPKTNESGITGIQAKDVRALVVADGYPPTPFQLDLSSDDFFTLPISKGGYTIEITLNGSDGEPCPLEEGAPVTVTFKCLYPDDDTVPLVKESDYNKIYFVKDGKITIESMPTALTQVLTLGTAGYLCFDELPFLAGSAEPGEVVKAVAEISGMLIIEDVITGDEIDMGEEIK